MACLQEHFQRRWDKHEVYKNCQHIDIISLVSIVSHSPHQTFAQIPKGNFRDSFMLLWITNLDATKFDDWCNIIFLFTANID